MKDDPTDKSFRPVCAVNLLLKVFERMMFYELFECMNWIHSSTKYHEDLENTIALSIRFLRYQSQKWQEVIDNSASAGTILLNLAKAYVYLPHEFAIVTFENYGISKSSLTLSLQLTSRKQRVKIGSRFYV